MYQVTLLIILEDYLLQNLMFLSLNPHNMSMLRSRVNDVVKSTTLPRIRDCSAEVGLIGAQDQLFVNSEPLTRRDTHHD